MAPMAKEIRRNGNHIGAKTRNQEILPPIKIFMINMDTNANNIDSMTCNDL